MACDLACDIGDIGKGSIVKRIARNCFERSELLPYKSLGHVSANSSTFTNSNTRTFLRGLSRGFLSGLLVAELNGKRHDLGLDL